MARIAVLTASDLGARGEREDTSGDAIVQRCGEAGHTIVERVMLPDDRDRIAAALRNWCDSGIIDIVLTTGGTGLSSRDVTPEATRDVAERDVPGIPILLAVEGLKKTPFAVLSRGVAVTRGNTLIIDLPGNPKAVNEGLDVLLPLFEHVASLLGGPTEHRSDTDTGHALRQAGDASAD
jgi:molybdenum cofactor synthesis domain-containing protein